MELPKIYIKPLSGVQFCTFSRGKKYLNGNYNLINSNTSNIKVGDNFSLSSFNNEMGIVDRISNNNIWIYLKSIGYSVKLKLA